MRIHGIHLQGLRAPRGEHRLQLDPTYNVVFVPDEASGAGLGRLLRAFLYPNSELGQYALWREPGPSTDARAGISFSFPADAYRIILDFSSERIHLGRYLPDSKKFERVSTEARAIESHLRGEGLPDPTDFAALYDVSGRLAALPPAEPAAPRPLVERARLERELEDTEGRFEARRKLEERQRELRRASERFAPLQENHDRLVQELAQRSVLADVIDDLEPRLQRVQQLDEERARERVMIEQERRDLLDERTELRGIPARQDFPLWIGAALLILGWLAGLLAHPYFYVFSGAGALSAAAALLVARAARRRMGGVEATLAALRVRERAVEREFESQSASIRGLMRTLAQGSLEDVAREAADYRGIVARLRSVNEELEGVRRLLPEGERDELAELEAQLAELGEIRDPDEIRAALASLSHPRSETDVAAGERSAVPAPAAADAGPGRDEDIDELIRSAALLAGTTDDEVVEQLGRVLPLYLKLLSGGAFQKARRRDVEGWLLRGEQRDDVVPYASLPLPLRVAVHLAFRLAILEALSAEYPLPLVIGPSLPFSGDEQLEDLARALERLGACTQVVQLSCDKGPWAEHAARQHVLSA